MEMISRQNDPRRELGHHVLAAFARALERPNSAPSLRLISQLVERYEQGAMSRAELFQRLERTS
jgi:hypothetical protein